MKLNKLVLRIVVFVFSLFVVACGSAEPPPPAATPTPEVHLGEALVASRCGTCHSTGVIENAKYDENGWKVTVERMVTVGASLNTEQQAQVIDYLAKTYPKQ